jgi:voltage-gated potassium channel Kch
MLVSIAALGAAIGYVTSGVLDFMNRKKRGNIMVRHGVDLIIAGYPNEAKVRDIVKEFRQDSRFAEASVVVITNRLEEAPAWMNEEDVVFIKGIASRKDVLERANIRQAARVLILADDPFDESSDELSSSVAIMCEGLNPDTQTVVEKVRDDDFLFRFAGCDLVVSVSRAGELVQELQDPGAIEFAETIFSNSRRGNQFNTTATRDGKWGEIVTHMLECGATAIGFRNPDASRFNFTPLKDDAVRKGAVIKYLASAPVECPV